MLLLDLVPQKVTHLRLQDSQKLQHIAKWSRNAQVRAEAGWRCAKEAGGPVQPSLRLS